MLASSSGVLVAGAALLFQLIKLGRQLLVIVVAKFVNRDGLYSNGRIITFYSHVVALVQMEPLHELFWYGHLFVARNAPKHDTSPQQVVVLQL